MDTTLFSKEEFKDILRESVVDITFEKVDGSIRKMTATLNPEIIPLKEIKETNDTKRKASSESTLAVWDMTNNGWRSFKWDKLKTLNGSTVEIRV